MKWIWPGIVPLLLATAAGAAEHRCCMTEAHHYYWHAPEIIDARFRIYRDWGVDMLRLEAGWRDLETAEGEWSLDRYRTYFDLVKKHGFRIKMIVGTIMAPPGWFLDQHPEARIINQNGEHSRNTVSYWYPELHALLTAKATRMFEYLRDEGLIDRVDFVVVDFGPAGEPIYPAAWTMGREGGEETYWCYGENAQRDFNRAMRAKYADLARLNAAWGTEFADWSEVIVPQPGERPGACWEDVLIWYRDTKREFVRWQIGNFREQVRRFCRPGTQLLLYVPGSDIRPEQWEEAVRTGIGPWPVRLMCDSRFLLATAGEEGCWLQYTGVENRPEVEHLRAYLDENGLGDVPMWGENAGYLACARDPVLLADIILDNRLYGLDFTHSHFAFLPDNITPHPEIAPELKRAYRMIREAERSE